MEHTSHHSCHLQFYMVNHPHKSTIASVLKTYFPASMPLTSEEFEKLADDIFMQRSAKLRLRMHNRRFRSGLGISSHVCSWYWNRLEEECLLPTSFQPKHFIWTLLFMKLYCAESVNATICGCNKKKLPKVVLAWNAGNRRA